MSRRTVERAPFMTSRATRLSYPLVLIPTFLVPASIILHVLVIARLRARTRVLPAARASRPREAPVEAR